MRHQLTAVDRARAAVVRLERRDGRVAEFDHLVSCGVPAEEAARRAGWPTLAAAEIALRRAGHPAARGLSTLLQRERRTRRAAA